MNEDRNRKALKGVALFLSAVCYAGAVAYGDIMFLQIMNGTFPSGFLGVLAMAGAVMTAVSAITIPIAIHFWFGPGLQYIWGIAFWVLDVIILALNSMLAYQVSLNNVDPLLVMWQNFSPATPLFAVIGWGLVYLLDPSHTEHQSTIELQQELADIRRKQRVEAAQSAEVFDIIKSEAIEDAKAEASKNTGKHSSSYTSSNGHNKNEPVAISSESNGNPTKR